MFRRTLVVPVLLFGPLFSIAGLAHMVGSSWLLPSEVTAAAVAILAMWSPLLFSIPALLMQDVRDATLDNWRSPAASLARGVVLLPYLCLARRSPARLEAIASLVGFAAGVILALAVL